MAEPAPAPLYDGRLAAAVAAQLADRPVRLATARVLAIDGPAGAGKTTLAKAVAARLADGGQRVEVLSLDDFYEGWAGLNSELELRVLNQVLRPLAGGGASRWQSYDWSAADFADWHVMVLPDVLVIEGCGAGARAYAPYTSTLVWLEADAQTRVARAVARDGDEIRRHWAGWAAAEERHFAANDTRLRADLVIGT